MNFPEGKHEQRWLMAFVALPFALLIPLAGQLTSDGGTKILVAGVLGLLGSMIGMGLYALVGSRTGTFRVLVLVVVLVAGLFLSLQFRP